MWCKVFRGTKCNIIIWSDVGDMVFPRKIFTDKNALTTGLNFAYLEIRSRSEEAINSTACTRWGFLTSYFIDVDTFYLFLNWFSTRVSDERKYVCGRRAMRVYKYTKIQGPRFQRNYIIARDQKSDLHGTSFQSSPKISRMLITRAICIQWKFTTPNHRSFAN